MGFEGGDGCRGELVGVSGVEVWEFEGGDAGGVKYGCEGGSPRGGGAQEAPDVTNVSLYCV